MGANTLLGERNTGIRDVKRGALAVLTSGTSEIQTGGGANKDETVADTLFPKPINDWALQDREKNRDKVAADAEAAKKALDEERPVVAPDLTDKLVSDARKAQMLRLLSGRGRASTFLTGPLSAP